MTGPAALCVRLSRLIAAGVQSTSCLAASAAGTSTRSSTLNLRSASIFYSSRHHFTAFVKSIMNNVDEAVDTAEAWHARHLVPYADGGAPWFSRIGLGPKFGPNSTRAKPNGADLTRCLEKMFDRSCPDEVLTSAWCSGWFDRPTAAAAAGWRSVVEQENTGSNSG